MPTFYLTYAGSSVDRGHRWVENQQFIRVFLVNKLAVNRFGLWMVGRSAVMLLAARGVSSSHIPIHYADKAPDGARSAISIRRDGVCSAIGMGHSSRNRMCGFGLFL